MAESKLRGEYIELLEAFLNLLRQQSKIKWTRMGDQVSWVSFVSLSKRKS